MKLRVKFSGQSQQIDFGETDASSLTLGEVKASVSNTFLLENRDVGLSLNKKDILSGDEIPISDLGIVPGDLIHIITDEIQNIPAASQRPQPIASHSNGSVVVQLDRNQHSQTSDDTVPPQSSEDTSDDSTFGSGSHPPQTDEAGSGMDFDSQRSRTFQGLMNEPLVLRESTPSHVPALLNELYSSSHSQITCLNDALFVLLHSLMLESGFSLPGNADITRLPEEWKRSGFYMCMYEYDLTPSVVSKCSLMGVPTGSTMAVHGLSQAVGNFKTEHLQLKAEHFVRDITQENAAAAFRSLDRLSNIFKDTISLALQNYLATSAGFYETQGLSSLPCEIRLRLMCFLDAKSVCSLGQTCQQWKAIYKDNKVWRRLYIQSFERPDNSSLSRNWYELFQSRYQQYLEEQERRRRFYPNSEDDFDIPPIPGIPFGPFHPSHPLPPPRLLGGDYDIHPQLPGMPGRRMRGPPSIFPGQSQGRIGRGRGNLTGSPFFGNGPFF